MRRRDAISLLGGAVIARPISAPAQPAEKLWRIAWLGEGSAPAPRASHPLAPFVEGLREHGYNEGRNLRIEFRWAEGRIERLPVLAAELVGLGVDVIMAPRDAGSTRPPEGNDHDPDRDVISG